ncbi:MAG: DUF3375 domain-containing protein [Bacteroidales bacterium]
MRYDEIEEKLKLSPSLKFLRSRNAALMICFFREQFKYRNEIALPYEILAKELEELIDRLHYVDEEDEVIFQLLSLDNRAKARRYIERWTEENYLRNYIDENTRKVFIVLTKHTERAFQMLELLREREFVGTESKFSDIFHKLEEVVNNSNPDPQRRIRELEQQQENIRLEIERIKKEGVVKTYEDYQIKSRMDDVYRLTNELVGDFKEVEENFREITKNIYEKQAEHAFTKGNLLGYAFDSVDRLKESDQGKSFYSFWQFLLNESEQLNLRDLIEKSITVMHNRNINFNDRFLRRIKTLLHSAGQKVLESNDQLGEKLSKVIAEKNRNERRKSQETIHQIRLLALKLTDVELPEDCGITLDLDPELNLPLERRLGEEQIQGVYDIKPRVASPKADLQALTKLFNPNLIDRKALSRNVKAILKEKTEVSLREVIEIYPLQKGLSELVAYITLSEQSQKVWVNEAVTEALLFDAEHGKYLEAPQIIYKR